MRVKHKKAATAPWKWWSLVSASSLGAVLEYCIDGTVYGLGRAQVFDQSVFCWSFSADLALIDILAGAGLKKPLSLLSMDRLTPSEVQNHWWGCAHIRGVSKITFSRVWNANKTHTHEVKAKQAILSWQGWQILIHLIWLKTLMSVEEMWKQRIPCKVMC